MLLCYHIEEGGVFVELITVSQVAEYLRIHPEVIRRWLREGKLQGHKVGGVWRIDKAVIDTMLKEKQN